MFGKTIRLSKEVYEDLIAERDKAREELAECQLKMIDDRIHWQDQWAEVFSRNTQLEKQNACLKTLIDKEGDTKAIKYSGLLYRIIDTTYHREEGENPTFNIEAVFMNEVG